MVELKKISKANFKQCLELEVTSAQQKFIDSCMYALAEAYVDAINEKYPPLAYAICNDDIVIGIVILVHKPAQDNNIYNENCYEVTYFMIAKQHQKKDYGRQAFAKVIDMILTFPEGKANAIYLAYDPENDAARHLFNSYGFVDTDKKNEYYEVVARLSILKKKRPWLKERFSHE